MDEKEAEAYGLTLSRDQAEALHGERKLVLVGQVMPDPMPLVLEGSRVPFYAHKPNHDATRVVVPTVVELASPDVVDESEWIDNGHYYQQGWDALPVMYGWAVDMSDIANGMDCGCVAQGDYSCGCEDRPLSVISPYSCVPVTEEQAKAITEAAGHDMPLGAWQALVEITAIENGIYGDDYGYEWFAQDYDPDADPDEYKTVENAERERIQLLTAPAYDFLKWNPNDPNSHLHVPKDQMSFVVPEGADELVTKLQRNVLRHGKKLQQVFRRSPRVEVAQMLNMFAYPCAEDPYLFQRSTKGDRWD